MKLRKSVLVPLISTLALACIFPIGFAGYVIFGDAQRDAELAFHADANLLLLDAISIQAIQPYSVGKYHYLDPDGNTTDKGGMRYQLQVDPTKLDNAQKNSNAQGGYDFLLTGWLECEESVFARDPDSYEYIYFDSVVFGGDSVVCVPFLDTRIIFDLTFSTRSKTQSQIFNLDILFSHQFMLDHKDDLASYSFVLTLWGQES